MVVLSRYGPTTRLASSNSKHFSHLLRFDERSIKIAFDILEKWPTTEHVCGISHGQQSLLHMTHELVQSTDRMAKR